MLSAFPIQFDRPAWLLLLLLIVPCYFMARRSIGGLSRSKATVTFALRVIVILLLTMSLAHPVWEKRGKGLTVTVLVDRSQSIPLPLKKSSLEFLAIATDPKFKEENEDRIAVITIAKDANIVAMPDVNSAVGTGGGGEEGDLTATNLAAGVTTALSIMPPDTANRIVLASDGNETMDSVLAAAELAKANKIPIDVLVLEYEHKNEVVFEGISAPPRARQGQSANIRMVLHGYGKDSAGTLHLKMNNVPMDLDPETEGDGMRINVVAGTPTVIKTTITLDSPGPKQFDAVFEPDNPGDDEIDRNNNAVAVTFVGGEGRVLVIDQSSADSEYLMNVLRQSNISCEQRTAPEVGGLVDLAGFDAVVLANVPRFQFTDDQDRDLHAYVHDLGGGLVMLGGPDSFGAGMWIGAELAKVLPVKLDPPQTRQMTRGALALVMHSCEMAQGNFWGQKVAITAIEALSRLDYVGICVYGWGGGPGINGASWAFPMSLVGDKSAPINAAKKMSVGDMPSFQDSMDLALNDKNGLMSVRAGQRHAIVISDGDPSPPTQALMQKYKDNGVSITTIMVGGHGTAMDNNKMNAIAQFTGGRFYNITNPKQLPAIFFKEAQVVSRSLIQEGDLYQPQIVSNLPGPVQGFEGVPSIDGYVLTAARDGLAQMPIVVGTSEGNDPIYANWNYGLGKSIAYTSDVTGRWGSRWTSWPEFKKFWEQSMRWVMRPSSPANLLVNTRLDGDVAVVELEALESDASFLNFMQTSAVVLDPNSKAEPLTLQQVGPGKYRAEFRTSEAGAYLVNIGYASGAKDAGGNPVKGNLQAAVCVPYSREFRAVRDNAALLKDLAKQTGGRELSPASPEIADLFSHEGLQIPLSPRQIWDLLAIIAAALFLFDVAARRISIDSSAMKALAGRAVGKRADASEATVAAWKRAKSGVSHRQTDKKVVKAEQVEDRNVKFEAAGDDAKRAIDVGEQVPQDMREKPVTQRSADAKPKQGDDDDGDYTGRLLAAKRRARGPEGEQDGKDKPAS